MPARAITPTPKTYAQLRDAVIAVIVTGRLAIDRAWVDTCHETGRLINEHVLLFRERADYGARIYEKLAEDTKGSARTLRECAQFQRGGTAANSDLSSSISEPREALFLNNALLEAGHAIRYDGGAKEE